MQRWRLCVRLQTLPANLLERAAGGLWGSAEGEADGCPHSTLRQPKPKLVSVHLEMVQIQIAKSKKAKTCQLWKNSHISQTSFYSCIRSYFGHFKEGNGIKTLLLSFSIHMRHTWHGAIHVDEGNWNIYNFLRDKKHHHNVGSETAEKCSCTSGPRRRDEAVGPPEGCCKFSA